MPSQSRKYRTQWMSTFFAAGELTRRGYLVTITHGNAKFVDLLVQGPGEESFSVDVKGMSAHNWIPVKKPDTINGYPHLEQYYILVYAAQNLEDDEVPRYFIMSSREMYDEIIKGEEEATRINKNRLTEGKTELKEWAKNGIAFKQAEKYKNMWKTLPGYNELQKLLNLNNPGKMHHMKAMR